MRAGESAESAGEGADADASASAGAGAGADADAGVATGACAGIRAAVIAAAAAVAVSGCACVSRVEPTAESITRFVRPGDTVRMRIYTGGRLKLLVTAVEDGQVKGRANGDASHPVWVRFGAIRALKRECDADSTTDVIGS